MELQDCTDKLQEKYHTVIDKFTYTGKEPEAKEQLRYLLRNQSISVASMSPPPQYWNAWTEECIKNADWTGLCRVINQRIKGSMIPVIYGGYTYQKNFHGMLEFFACGNIGAMERILPLELSKMKNCDDPFFPVAINLLIGLWYKDKAVLEWVVPEAEKFLEKKKATIMEKAIVAFLLDLVSGDMEKGSEDLLAVCKGYPRDQKYVLGVRPFCTFAHGLYCLAQLLLPEGVFQTLEMPKYKNFIPEFAMWKREYHDTELSLWFRYPKDMELLNEIFEAPPARLILWQSNPNDKKPEWTAHGVKWVDNYVDDLWDMGMIKNKA